ncbi:CHAP domain-containing protein [candidate division WS5 bacterium]|uniref:CHAP domain-containing protein n=1 Tax=candidate division WS5 bacterium TaxID=2093353 RepID=A0A419D9X1_9BACT|nr:MAG: CHAP domain-containing protein [candidate division WS5 bacterium]
MKNKFKSLEPYRQKKYFRAKREVDTCNMKQKIQRVFAILLIFPLILLGLPEKTHVASAASLDEINGQIDQLSESLEAKRGEINTIQGQVDVLNAQIRQLELEMEATQIEINQTVAQINDLQAKITQTEKELKAQQKILAEYLRVIYEESNISPMEQIAGSNNFSDFVDRGEYLQTMQSKIKETVDKINKIKAELEAKKAELDKKRVSLSEMQKKQSLQKQSLDGQRAVKDQLLAKANAEASGIEGKLNDLYAQKAAMSAQYGEAVMRGGSGYPFGNPPPGNIIDTPDPWGYLIGECTSYVAWKRAVMGRPIPRAMGNAGQWAWRANSGPVPGAVAIFPYVGGYGHVAMVEAVYGNGTILISEYNWIPFSYSTRVINPYSYSIVYLN